MASKNIIYVHDLTEIVNNFEGTKYVANGLVRSFVTKDTVFKDLTGFGGDYELAKECLYIWKELCYQGAPSSPASFFRKEFHEKGKVKASSNNLIRPFFHGGWQENFISGSVLGKIYLYDIVKAYLWSSKLGFPSKVFPYCKGDEEKFHCIGIFKPEYKREDLPIYFRKDLFVASTEDIDRYGLKGKFIRGYSWKDYDIQPFETIMNMDWLPAKAWKMLTQGFWGIWAQTNPIRVHYSNGNKRKMNNYFQNLVWAQLVVNRVIWRIWEKARKDALSVYVDSILTKQEIENKDEIGRFKLKEVFNDGVFIKSAGVWVEINKYTGNLKDWNRHAGY